MKKKILIYGGCHAVILKKLIEKHCVNYERVDIIINFEIIGNAQPFPYENIKNYDLVLYSPVINKEEYNTIYLQQECFKHKVVCISFPWLQWNGYYPSIVKKKYQNQDIWLYQRIMDEAIQCNSLSDFFDKIYSENFMNDIITTNFLNSNSILYKNEVDQKVDVIISSYIKDNYHTKHLFMTPDHPSKFIYYYVFGQISNIADLKCINIIDIQNELEPQGGDRVPILPSVIKNINISFNADIYALEANQKFEKSRFFFENYFKMVKHEQCD